MSRPFYEILMRVVNGTVARGDAFLPELATSLPEICLKKR
jgi:hypothetical protein